MYRLSRSLVVVLLLILYFMKFGVTEVFYKQTAGIADMLSASPQSSLIGWEWVIPNLVVSERAILSLPVISETMHGTLRINLSKFFY